MTTFNAISYPNTRNITLDASLGEIYSVGDEPYGGNGSAVVISSYGMKSQTLDGILAFPGISYPVENNLVRWGTDGMAFIGPGPADQEIYLVRSSVVSPKSSNPTPVLTTVAPASVIAGGSSFTLTANGTAFVANSIIEWNGGPLATTYVSSQELTAAVPASAMAQSGTAQVAVYTPAPGGGSSVAQVFAIVSAVPAVTLSQSQLTFGNQAQGIASSAQTITLNNSGTATFTISSISASGDFNATSNCGVSVVASASCTISVTFTPSTTESRTGTLTITDNAANSPQTVSLSGTGVAAMTINPSQGGSTSATVSSGTTATYNLSIAAATGVSGSVNLSCSGAPQYATCSASPTSLNLTSGGTGAFIVTVSTTTTQSASAKGSSTIVLAGMGLLALLTMPLIARIRWRPTIMMAVICSTVSLIAFGATGCGGGGGGGGGSKSVIYTTPPGTYTLTLTASVSGASASQKLTLVVQ